MSDLVSLSISFCPLPVLSFLEGYLSWLVGKETVLIFERLHCGVPAKQGITLALITNIKAATVALIDLLVIFTTSFILITFLETPEAVVNPESL